MAGHSQFKNIMHRKGAQDAKRGKLFAKLTREIIVAARNGLPDTAANPRLRAAIQAARQVNMPRDNIDRAIRRAVGGEDTAEYSEIRYEGYGPGGVALIVEALTDNRNRTAAEVRSLFSKYGGSLGESNSVAFLFDRGGEIVYPGTAAHPDKMFEMALEAGADNVESLPDAHVLTTQVENFSALLQALEGQIGEAEQAALVWRPRTTAPLTEENAPPLFKLIEALEDNDDVQKVFANYDASEALLEALVKI